MEQSRRPKGEICLLNNDRSIIMYLNEQQSQDTSTNSTADDYY